MPAASALAGAAVTGPQRSRRRAIRWTSAAVGLTFYTVLLLGPALAGLITQ